MKTAKTAAASPTTSIGKITKEISEYNRKHNTFITYGKYVVMKEGKCQSTLSHSK